MTLRRSSGLRRLTDAEISTSDRNRSSHIGTQPMESIDGLQPALDEKAKAALIGVEPESEDLGEIIGDLVANNSSVKSAIQQIVSNLAAATGDERIGTVDGLPLREALLNRVSTRSLLWAGGVGEAYFNGTSWIADETDDDAVEQLITKFRTDYARLFTNSGLSSEDFKQATSEFVLQLQRRFWYLTRDMPEIPAGVPIDMEGSVIVIGNHNIRVLRTQAGGQTLPQPGGATLANYGADYLHWKLPTIIANGHSGTFVHLNTIAHSRFTGLVAKGATGTTYTVSGAATNGSRFIGLSPADYAKVKWGDVITDSAPDPAGNPRVFQAKDTRVINPGATGRTYGYIKLSEPWTGASGNINFTQCSFPVVCTGVQQSEWNRNYYTECDWKVFWGSGPDEVVDDRGVGRGYGDDADWLSETFTNLNPCTDMRIFYDKSEKCKYAVFVERGCSMMNFIYPSYQFNSIGSEFISRAINCKVDNGRVENRRASLVAAGDKEIPSFVAIDSRLDFTGHLDWVPNDEGGTARYLLGVYGQSNVRVESWGTNSNQLAPLMPDGSRSPFIKPSFDGTLWVGTCRGINGPNAALNYADDPLKWATNGANAPVFVNYRGDSGQSSGTHVRIGPALRIWFPGEGADSCRQPGDSHNRVEIRTDAGVWFGPGNNTLDCSIRRISGALVYESSAAQHRFNGAIYIDNVAVLGARRTGWSADSGTAKRSANTTYSAPTISNPPTQAEVQAMANALQDTTQALKALKDDLIALGMLGA